MTTAKVSPMNAVWFFMIIGATVVAAYRGTMEEVTTATFESAKSAVTLAISLIGPMALWLGIMKIVEAGGLMRIVAKAIRPLMVRLFPDVPAEHPAMSAMIMNMAANALGLGNAATPMGLKAMHELEKINPQKGTASNAMCLFLAINTSSVTLLPLGVINVRAGAGALHPAAIILPSLLATAFSTTIAIIAAKLLAGKSQPLLLPDSLCTVTPANDSSLSEEKTELFPPGLITKVLLWISIVAFIAIVGQKCFLSRELFLEPARLFNVASHWLMPVLMCGLLIFGFLRGVKVYEVGTDGAKEGFSIAIRIVPFLVAIFVAIGMLRASGAIDLLVTLLNPITNLIGMPAEALPMALLRPLSGSGAYGVMAEIVTKAPDSFTSYLVSTMQGSTETTFYVLAVYCGSIGLKRMRHALPAALLADAAGLLGSVFICRLFY